MKKYIKSNQENCVHTVVDGYIPELDITVVFQDTHTQTGEPISMEVTGFYYGTPNTSLTNEYSARLKSNRIAYFEDDNEDYVRSSSIMGSAWKAPNGKSYGKQTKRFPGKYLFTRKELKSMVDSGIAQDLGGTFDPMKMNYDIIGISWNETNGYRSGILIVDNDTGELYVGNSADANVAKL